MLVDERQVRGVSSARARPRSTATSSRRAFRSVPLEELDGALVLLRGCSAPERPEVLPLSTPRILLLRVEPVLPRGQSTNHWVSHRPEDVDGLERRQWTC